MQQPIQQAMPQSIQQQEQLAAQQMQQQMMLCPVRVVYETQILVQPGDQIQPNQTLFINPQNPPPWAQNRQIQNQPVIYVQQMPNNIIPSVPHQIDQNQLFLQQYQNYQQMIPQQMVNHEQRMQLQNIIPQNMIQSFQANMNPNVPNMPDRIPQSYPVQNVGPTIQMQPQQQPQLNLVNNIKREPGNVQIVQPPQQSQPNNQRVEIKPGVYMNVGPQFNQQHIRPSPQVLTVNPIQNNPQTNANIQPIPPNVLHRPIQTHSVGSQMSPPTFASPTNSQPSRIRKVAPTTVNKVTNTNVGVRGVGQTYRPIQPRPQQFRSNTPSYPNTINMQAQQNKPLSVAQNVININSTLPSMPNLNMNMPSSPIPYIKPEDNTNTKKRKSESPDEIHKKMAAIQVNITTPLKPVTVPNRSIEVGVNTQSFIPMQRTDQKPNLTVIPKSIQTINAETQVAELKHISKLVENVQQAIQKDKTNVKMNPDAIEASNTEKDKLIRNTVYPQARGRVLTDKENLNIGNDNQILPKSETKQEIKVSVENIKVENATTTPTLLSPKVEVKLNKGDMHAASVSLNTANNKGMLPVDRSVKQEKDFVLTHVLDGIVIQESNIAFPIREPATRRFVQQLAQKTENKSLKESEENKVEEKFKVPCKDMPMIPSEASEGETKDNKSQDGDDPFSMLEHVTVKSWTTENLSEYLTKHKWGETASLFMDHEIDGESLFLVSKTQLLTIGVKENHADLICSFVKS